VSWKNLVQAVVTSSETRERIFGKLGANGLVRASAVALPQKSLELSIQKLGNGERTANFFAQKNRFVVGALRQDRHFANRSPGCAHSYSFSCFGICADRGVQTTSTS
jgi:hypothetical protein